MPMQLIEHLFIFGFMKSLSPSHQKYMIDLGTKLRDIRRSKVYSQAQLAIDAEMEVSQISRIERGVLNTSVLTLLKIAVVLDVELSDLLPTHLSEDRLAYLYIKYFPTIESLFAPVTDAKQLI